MPVVLVGHLGRWCWVIAKWVGLVCFGELVILELVQLAESGGGHEA